MEYEAEQISQQAPDQYHLAFDNSIAAYSSALDSSLTKEIPALSMLVGDGADGIDTEAEVCRLVGFDPATYALVEDLTADSAESDTEEN